MKQKRFRSILGKITRKGGRSPVGAAISLGLAAAMVACLMLPLSALANEQTLICGLDGLHIHNADCYAFGGGGGDDSPVVGRRDFDTEGVLDIYPPLGELPGGFDGFGDGGTPEDEGVSDEYVEDGEDGEDGEDDEDDEDYDESIDGDDDSAELDDEETYGVFESPSRRDTGPFSVNDSIPFEDAPIAVLRIPVVKQLAGDGALDELAAASEQSNFFKVEIEKITFGRQLEDRDDLEAILGDIGSVIDFVEFRRTDFENVQMVSMQKELEVAILSYTNAGLNQHVPHYFIISEKLGTAGDNWIYDTNRYVVEVIICEDGREIAVYSVTAGEEGLIRTAIGGVYVSGAHNRRNPNKHVPTNEEFWVYDFGKYEINEPVDNLPIIFEHFTLRYGGDNGEMLDDLLALCAQWRRPSPGEPSDQGDGGVEYIRVASRAHTRSALAYSLFDENDGAKVLMDDFNDLFGFVDNPMPGSGELEKLQNNLEGEKFRRVLIQYAVWYYEELANPAPNIFPREYCIHNPDLRSADPNDRRNAWPYTPDAFDRRNNPATYHTANVYTDFTLYVGEEKGEYLLRVLDILNIMFDAYNHSEDCDPSANPECYVVECWTFGCRFAGVSDHYVTKMGRCIEKDIESGSVGNGDSITSLKLRQTNIDADTVNFEIEYTGYIPPRIGLTLVWTPSANTVVSVISGGNQRVLASGDSVHPDEVIQASFTNPVTFTLSDSVISLAIDSVRGSLLRGTGHYNNGDGRRVKPSVHDQDLIIGTAQFMTLSYTLTVGGSPLGFANVHTVFQFPETFGIGAGLFYITGALAMIIAAAVVFAGNIKPAKQTTQGADISKLIPRRVQRSIKNRQRFDKLE